MRSRNTRRATAVAAMATGALAAGGAGTAMAAPFPISISFTDGTVTAGTFPAARNASAGAPASFAGTIESDTFVATFPADRILLPEATLENVAVGSVTASTLAIDATPTTAFTGTVSVDPLTMNLTGSIRYRFVATVPRAIGEGNDTFSCTLTPAVPVTFNGSEINLATGAYGAAGSAAATPVVPDELASAPFCLQLATKVPLGSSLASAFSGTLTIPGLVPTPTGVPVIVPPTTTATPTPAPTPSPTATKVPRLKVSIAKPKTVRRGSSTIAKVTVRNTGTATVRGVRLSVKLPSRTTTRNSRTKTWTTIGAGRTRSFSVRVRTTKRTAKRTKIRATVTGTGGLRATGTVTLRLR